MKILFNEQCMKNGCRHLHMNVGMCDLNRFKSLQKNPTLILY